MKKPVTYGAHRILHDLFKNGAMFKHGLHSEKLRELEERGYAAVSANSLVYLTPTGQQYAIESFVGESLLASEYYARATAPADNAGPYEAELCGNSIEQETLSAVLVHYLPTTNLDKASDHAVKLASAVKTSFNELNATTNNAITDQNGAKLTATGTLSSGDKPDTASGRPPASWFIKATGGIQTLECRNFVAGMNPADKPDSTVKVKLELDTSEAMKSLDELGSMAKKIDAIVAEALQQNGSIFSAINQRERNEASLDDLSARVSQLENVVNSHSANIQGLDLRVLHALSGR
ncbi:TPA: hypothetical protein ACYSBZ_005571 [Klebsiella oxytoca]